MSAAPLLLVEDTASLRLVYESVLRSAGYRVQGEGTAEAGMRAFRGLMPGIVLLDLSLPDRDGLDLMEEMLALRPETAVIVITANGSLSKAVAAMRAGAHEFLVKPFDEQRLLNAIANAGARPPAPVTPSAVAGGQDGLGAFIGASPAMQDVYGKIRSVARSMATVFITGESGTGKELCAQAVHDLSNRSDGPFVPLNCGAIPSELLESEVFGHLRGSFTGAISDKPGAAALADGGTLFLDEICELDLNLQTKLLRFLQTSTIQPVGSARPRKVNVRILCATNRDPLDAVRRGQFREDLYYRLYVVPIRMPALRDRGDDVNLIAEAALTRFASEEGRAFSRLSSDVRRLFGALPWPGNVRQLLNVIRNVVVLNDGVEVTVDMLPSEIHQEIGRAASGPPPSIAPARHDDESNPPRLAELEGKTLSEIEEIVIERAIARHGGSVPRAARELAVSPSTIYRKREGWARRNP